MAADLKAKIVVAVDGKPAVAELGAVAAAEARVGSAGQAAGAKAAQGLAAAGRAAKDAEPPANALADAYSTVAQAAGTIAGAGAVLALATTADEVRILRDRVRAIVGDSGDWRAVWAEIYQISQANGTAVADTVQLYQRLSTAAERLGASSKEVLTVVQAVQQLGRMGGSTAEEIRQVSVQFGQMLSSPMAQAEELNTILDGMPALAREIEKGLNLMPGGLKAAVNAGLETSKIFDVLLRQAGDIDRRAQDAAGSIAQALTAMRNTLGSGLNAVDEALGAGGKSWTDRWSSGVAEIARRLDGLVARFRKGFVASDAGVDPRLAGQERLNALLVRYQEILEQADAAQQRWRANAFRSGAVLGASRQAALAAAEIKRLQQELDITGEAINRTRAAIAATVPAIGDLDAKAVQAALAAANAAYAGANGFAKLKGDIAGASDALTAMGQALKGPAPTATYGDRLREIIALRDQAEASLKTGDLATALPKIERGAKAIQEFIESGGVADGTIGSLALQFQRMGDAAQRGARDGKDAVDAAAKAMKVDLKVRPVLDEEALAAITARLRSAVQVTPEMLRAAGLAGAENTTAPRGQSAGARIAAGAGSTNAAGAAEAMVEAASRAARATVERAFRAPLSIRLDASVAAAEVVREVQEALNAARLTVPVTGVVTEVQGGGAGGSSSDLERSADKTGTMRG